MSLTVSANTVVTLQYRVTDPEGQLMDPGESPLVYLHGGHGDLFAPLEAALDGLSIGASVEVPLTADEAFGPYDPDAVRVEPRDQFGPDLQPGTMFEGEDASDPDAPSEIYIVVEVDETQVVLDSNHPLAGLDLVFHCTVAEVRAALPDEIEAGHAMEDEADDSATEA